MLNAPLHIKWITDKVKKGELENNFINDLYADFTAWVKKTREGKEETMMTMTAFGLLLNNNIDKSKLFETDCVYDSFQFEGEKKRSNKGMYMKWNVNGVVEGLKKLDMLDEDFKYEEIINDFENTTEETD